MPLTTKNSGTRKPNPMPSSLDSNSSTSRRLAPPAKSLVTMPAANAPSSTSSPSSLASHTMAARNSTARRMATWPLVVSVVWMMREMRRFCSRWARNEVRITTATKASSTSTVRPGASLPKRTAMATIGPSSPIADPASTSVPNCVASSPLSWRIGSRMPNAVVVTASPTRKPDWASGRPSTLATKTPRAERGDERDAPPGQGPPQRAAADALQVDLEAGEEHQRAQPERGQEVDDVVELGPAEGRPDQDAGEDLEDHGRQSDHRAEEVGEHRRQRDRGEDHDQRRQRRLGHRPPSQRTARSSHRRPVRGPARRSRRPPGAAITRP